MAFVAKKILVLGAGGFIGSHLVRYLKQEGAWVKGVDLKYPEFSKSAADEFVVADLRKPDMVEGVIDRRFDEIYQLAADMGGAGFIFTGQSDAEIMHNSALINLNVLEYAVKQDCKNIFYSSSACIYPEHNQEDPDNPICAEHTAYPANPDSEYGWEKLFSERLYMAFHRNYDVNCKIARYHNIFGPEGTYDGGREKAPAAICRKIASVSDGDVIEIWGDGKQTRSFLYIDECIEATVKFMRDKSDFRGPLNIGSEEMVTINELVRITSEIADKKVRISHIDGPLGVRGRNSDNSLIDEKLKWQPKMTLHEGLKLTYGWIEKQVLNSK